MTDHDLAQLKRIASQLNLTHSPDASYCYDSISDSLLWSDELPPMVNPSEFWCLRPVLRYRTSLFLGQPDEDYREYWLAAQRLFPQWPGFMPSRQSPALRDQYLRLKSQAVAEFDSLLDN